MLANHFGKYFGITTFGESHGEALGIVFDDVKPGIDFPYETLRKLLDERRPGRNEFMSPRKENDEFRVISGVLNGKTTGMPICILFDNTDARPQDYDYLQNCFRPGHADFSWFQKYKIYDWRGGGRASGRETICRVAGSSLTEQLLGNIKIESKVVQIGEMKSYYIDERFAGQNPLKWADPMSYDDIVAFLEQLRALNDSIGAVLEVIIRNVPLGLGDPVFEKLDANLAKALISIGGVKGIEFGDGFMLAEKKGSEANDQLTSKGFLSNHSGGILGGVSTGQNIILRISVKPVSSIGRDQKTINHFNEDQSIRNSGRHDVCLVPRIIPVVEAMIKLVLADAMSYQNMISGIKPGLTELREKIDKIDEDLIISLKKRMMISQEIGQYKKENNIPVEDKGREEDLIFRLKEMCGILGLDADIVNEIWQIIIKLSRESQ